MSIKTTGQINYRDNRTKEERIKEAKSLKMVKLWVLKYGCVPTKVRTIVLKKDK